MRREHGRTAEVRVVAPHRHGRARPSGGAGRPWRVGLEHLVEAWADLDVAHRAMLGPGPSGHQVLVHCALALPGVPQAPPSDTTFQLSEALAPPLSKCTCAHGSSVTPRSSSPKRWHLHSAPWRKPRSGSDTTFQLSEALAQAGPRLARPRTARDHTFQLSEALALQH